MFKKCIFFIVFCLCQFSINAQNYSFKNYTTEDGLSSNFTFDILEGDNGYLWVSTANGVSKFNGASFKNFKVEQGLSSNLLNKIYKDSKNRIWIGTQNGGVNYIENDSVINLGDEFKGGCKYISNFLEKPNGNILIFSQCGIYEFIDGEIIKISNDDESFNLGIQRGVWLDTNTILAATINKGLQKITLQPYKAEKVITNPTLNNICYTIIKDSSGVVWIGTYGELVKFLPESQSITKYKFNPKEFNSNRVQSIYELNKEELLLGLEGNGIVIFNKETGNYKMYNKRNGMPSDYVYGVTQDFEGNIWAADLEKGLIGFRDTSTIYYDDSNGFATKNFSGVIPEGKDSVLVATSKGLYRMVNNVVADTVITGIHINAISKIKTDEYLISQYRKTEEHEYYRTFRYKDFIKKTLVAKGIYGYSYVDDKNIILPGFGEYLIIKKDTSYKVSALETRNIFKIEDNEYLIGSQHGIFRFDEKQIFKIDALLPDARVYNGFTQINNKTIFAADTADKLYAITYEESTYNVKEYNYKQFGLHETVNALTSDANNLWIGTASNLKKVDINFLLNNDSIKIKTYPLNRLVLKSGFNISQLKLVDEGVLYGTTLDKLVIFNEKKFIQSTSAPILNLSSVLLFAEGFDENMYRKSNSIEFPYNKNHLTFNMEAISYTYPETIKYKFRLKGLRGSEWSENVSFSKVVYSYLPPGDYNFEFVADNGNGEWAEQPYSYAFRIKIPFWKLPLFWIVIIIGVSGVVLYSQQQRNKIKQEQAQKFSKNLLTAQEKERNRVAKDLHDSVGQQLTLIKKKAQNLNQKELSEMSNTALEEVRSISRGLYPSILKQLGFTQSVEQLVNDLDEGVDMFFTVDVDEIDNDLDEEKSLNLYRFIQESLNNVIKHSNAKAVTVTISKKANQIEALISDNGKGFNSSVFKNSLGLKTMEERIRILKGTLSIKSRIDQGTTIIAQIPV